MRPFPVAAVVRRYCGGVWGARVLTFARFGAVGVLTAAVYGAVLLSSVEFAKLPPAVGAGVAYLMAIAFNYVAHYGWTFRSNESHGRAAVRYFIVVSAILCTNVLATGFLPKILNASYLFVQVGLAICAAGGSFLSQYLWVFRAKRPNGGESNRDSRVLAFEDFAIGEHDPIDG